MKTKQLDQVVGMLTALILTISGLMDTINHAQASRRSSE